MNPDIFGAPRFDTLPDEVREVRLRIAQRMVARYHYLHRPPVGHRFSLGIYVNGAMMGVMIFGRPVARCEDQLHTVELTRMFLFDSPKNSESRSLSLAEKWIKKHHPEIDRLIAYADEDAGHRGTIYAAANWTLKKIGKRHPHGWTSREGRIEDSGGRKLKFERLLNVKLT